MLNLDVFLSRLLPSLPGCPDPLVRQALVDTAIEFCEETGIVRVTSEPQSVTAGVAEYDVDLPPQQRVVTTQRAWYGAVELKSLPSTALSNVRSFATPEGVDVAPGDPKYFFESAPGVITVFPAPKVSAPLYLTFRVTTKPTRAATALEAILFEDWVDAMVAGTLARLHATPDTPYSSAQASQVRRAEFQYHLNRARVEALRGRVRSSVSMSRNRFAP